MPLVLDIELEDVVQCGPPVRLLRAGDTHLGDQCVLLAKVDHHFIDFCNEVASIDQLDSGLNNEISLVVDTIYLCHVMHCEVDKLLLNAGDVSHVRALAIARNTDQLVGPGHTKRAKKHHEHFDLQVNCMTTEVWHRDQMKVVEDPFDRDADVNIEERGAAMGVAIKRNIERPHIVAREQDADLGQSDADEHTDILADQMVTHTAQLSDAHHITRVFDCGRDLLKRHAARRMFDDELKPLDVLNHDDVRPVVSFAVRFEQQQCVALQLDQTSSMFSDIWIESLAIIVLKGGHLIFGPEQELTNDRIDDGV